MLKRSSLLTVAIAAVVAGSLPNGAGAGVRLANGISTKGMNLGNGISSNGVHLANGLTTNGLNLSNGLTPNSSLFSSGVTALQGIRLVLPDGTELAFR